MASLYKDLVRSGIPTDHHESDLYVLDTPEARETVKKYGYKFETFTSSIDGKRWIDVPFAYEPFWENKEQTRRGAPSGERTVDAATRNPAHARKRSAWPSVIGSHDLGTADVRTGEGAYWIVTVPTGYRVDYKPWGPSNEIDLGTFSSRQRARAKITEHAGSADAVRSHATKKAARRGTPKFQKFDEQSGDDWFPLWKFREMIVDGRIFDEDGSGKYGKLDGGQRMVSDVKVDLSRFATSESFDRRVPLWAKGVVWRDRSSKPASHARKITSAPGDPKRYPGYAIASGGHGDDAYFRSKEAAFRAAKRLANEKNRRVEIARITKNQDRQIVDEVYPSGW